jgi:hypothetical protein
VPKTHKAGFQLSWTTVTYRSVLLVMVGLVALSSLVLYVLFPEQSRSAVSKAANAIGDWMSGTGGRKTAGSVGPQAASFTAIDGTVRVKKANSNTWINAQFNVPLEKGDVVQTSAEGMAKVVFADNTNYTIKQDSLIVIQENSTNIEQQTQVAVELTTGTVDLSTAQYTSGSKSKVILAGATASLAPESAAMVHNDPRNDQHELLVKKGSGEISRGSEVMKLAEYERVSFKADAPRMTKLKDIAPPTLIAPANMLPIFVNLQGGAPVDFSWSPVKDAQTYHVRISHNPYFSSTLYDKKVPVAQVKVGGMGEGAYYWTVQSVNTQGKESVESEKNRFTVIAKGTDSVEIALELSPFVQHGHVIEVKGKTERNARVMVNGAEVPYISNDGSFQFFTPPLPDGENTITVTAQNAKGGVKTRQKKVVIQ